MALAELIGGFSVALVGLVLLLGAAKADAPLETSGNWALAGLVIGVGGVLFFLMGAMALIADAVFA
jgi:hypothetical protein